MSGHTENTITTETPFFLYTFFLRYGTFHQVGGGGGGGGGGLAKAYALYKKYHFSYTKGVLGICSMLDVRVCCPVISSQ